jgi:hypothetical protein
MEGHDYQVTMDKFQQPPVYMGTAELGKYWAGAMSRRQAGRGTIYKMK